MKEIDFIKEGLKTLQLHKESSKPTIRLFIDSRFPLYQVIIPENKSYVVKVMTSYQMAITEKNGLDVLAMTGINVPNCYGVLKAEKRVFLYMDFVATEPVNDLRISLKNALLKLYKTESDFWGWPEDNFIGPLLQQNRKHMAFSDFWWQDRIEPQLNLALKNGLLKKSLSHSIEKIVTGMACKKDFNSIKPRLIHGDLWSGNIIHSVRGATLIDPSVSFSHPEQDLAMLHLFGSPLTIDDMIEISISIGMPAGFKSRIPFWQIYPLLVHVNIFGGSYVQQLERAVNNYG